MNQDDGYKSAMEDILQAVKKILNKAGIKSIVDKFLKKEYDKGLESVDVQFNFNSVRDEDTLKVLQDYTFDNIKGMNEEIANKLRREIQEAVMNLETIEQMKERVKKVMNVGENRIKAIANTELGRAENFGKLDAAKQASIRLKKYLLITYDSRTSDISKAMGAKYGRPDQAIGLNDHFVVEVKGKTYRGLAPPFHPHDRDVVQFVDAE